MIIVDNALRRREAEGRPIRVGMVGAGFMGRGVALQIASAVPGMRLAAIAARRPEQAVAAFAQSMEAAAVAHAQTAGQISAAIAAGRPVVTEDPAALAMAEGLDAILEVTGSMDYALAGVLAAIATGKHVLMMNAELDGLIGPWLRREADRAGVIYSNVDGDQPGVQANLLRFVRGLGVKPLLSGNIKALQDPARTPETQRSFAEKWGQQPHMVTSFADGTKIAFEQALVANAFGMQVAKRGMLGFDPTNKDPTQPSRALEEYLPLFEPHLRAHHDGPGLVDFVVGARPGPGVFVIGMHTDPRQQHYLNLYKLGAGPYYLFYTPYHLCHFEAPLSIARAVLFQDAVIAPEGPPKVGVAATAKRDLAPGDVLDGLGGFDTYGEAENMPVMLAENLLPIALAEGRRVLAPVAKGQTLRFSDVSDAPAGRRVDGLYAQQCAEFGSGSR
jgi:predicted homoserine dehydrogenase-like protein